MIANAIYFTIVLGVCAVTAQPNTLATDLKPPPAVQPIGPAHVSHQVPTNLPPLPPPMQIPPAPAQQPLKTNQSQPPNPTKNNPPIPKQLPLQAPAPVAPVIPPQFPPKLPPTLPPQLQPQLPIQLPSHLQQQIPFQLQPQLPPQNPPPFNTNLPQPLPPSQNKQQPTLLPPQLPAQLPTQFPPQVTTQVTNNSQRPVAPKIPQPPPSNNLQRPAPPVPKLPQPPVPKNQPNPPPKAPQGNNNQQRPPPGPKPQNKPVNNSQKPAPVPPAPNNIIRPASVGKYPKGPKVNSTESMRAAKTLQMIGAFNPFMFHKISDNLRPGTSAFYFRKNNKPKPNDPLNSPVPVTSSQQFNQLQSIIALNQQHQQQVVPQNPIGQNGHPQSYLPGNQQTQLRQIPLTNQLNLDNQFNQLGNLNTFNNQLANSSPFNNAVNNYSPNLNPFNNPGNGHPAIHNSFINQANTQPAGPNYFNNLAIGQPAGPSPFTSQANSQSPAGPNLFNSQPANLKLLNSHANSQPANINHYSNQVNSQPPNNPLPIAQVPTQFNVPKNTQPNSSPNFQLNNLFTTQQPSHNQYNNLASNPLTNPKNPNQYTKLDPIQIANILNQLGQPNQVSQPHSHNVGPPNYVKPLPGPLTPQEVLNEPDFRIQPISIPAPASPLFETERNRVNYLKAKHKQFFDQQQHTRPPKPFIELHQAPKLVFDKQHQPPLLVLEQLQQSLKPYFEPQNQPQISQPPSPPPPPPNPTAVYGPPQNTPLKHVFELKPSTAKPDISHIVLTTKKPTIDQQSKLLPTSWGNAFNSHRPRAPVVDYDQYSAPKGSLPIRNDFRGFPHGKGSANKELKYISNWEKAIGIIHKNDHDLAKGETIISHGDTDDFKKIDNDVQSESESNKVEVISADQSHYAPEVQEEKPKKKPIIPKKPHAKKRHPLKKQREEAGAKPEQPINVTAAETEEPKAVEASNAEGENQDHHPRRKRDVTAVEGTTEGIVVSPENANTAAPRDETTPNNQPHAEPLVAPNTELPVKEVGLQATERPYDEVPVGSARSAEHSEEQLDSIEGELFSSEEEAAPHAEALVYDDYDDAYLDEDAYAPGFQARSDSYFFEEFDGTTSRPYAEPLFATRSDNESTIAQAEALVDPRRLHGRDLMRFLDEAIRNSSKFLPDEAEDRSFDIVDPPTDVIKFPYYDKVEEAINVDSALRFAENLTTFTNSLYKSKDANLCNEVDIELSEEPAEPGPDGLKPIKRLKRLGNKIDCLKNKHFGKEPLDNPLFKEEFVGVSRSSKDASLPPQPDPSVAVFSDVIRLIKQHLTEETRSHPKVISQIVTPRQLNLSDQKVHSSNLVPSTVVDHQNAPESKTNSPNTAVLEQLRLGKRRILPKPTKKVEEVNKTEQKNTTTVEQHPLKIVFPRRLNFTKTYDEAKKVSQAKLNQTKQVELETQKIKLNHTRTDHEVYKASLARKLNFDKFDKLKIPRSQRRESTDESPFDIVASSSRYYPRPQIFDISTFYPVKKEDNFFIDENGNEQGIPPKVDFWTLERKADELINSVRQNRADKRIINISPTHEQPQEDNRYRSYGTSYSPVYKEFQVLSALKKARSDDQKKPPSLNQLINFYSERRDGSVYHSSYSVPRVNRNLPIFDVSSFYPKFTARADDDVNDIKNSLTKRKDSSARLTLEDLEALQAPPKEGVPTGRKVESSFKHDADRRKHVTPAPVRDDIADFFQDSLVQPTSSTPPIVPKETHHTFKKAEPPNPDLPSTDKAALDQTVAANSVKKALVDPPKIVRPRKYFKTKPKTLKRPLLKYRRKKVLKYYP